jgi:hypothetical protein
VELIDTIFAEQLFCKGVLSAIVGLGYLANHLPEKFELISEGKGRKEFLKKFEKKKQKKRNRLCS